MCGRTRRDGDMITKEVIRAKVGVASMVNKMNETVMVRACDEKMCG